MKTIKIFKNTYEIYLDMEQQAKNRSNYYSGFLPGGIIRNMPQRGEELQNSIALLSLGDCYQTLVKLGHLADYWRRNPYTK